MPLIPVSTPLSDLTRIFCYLSKESTAKPSFVLSSPKLGDEKLQVFFFLLTWDAQQLMQVNNRYDMVSDDYGVRFAQRFYIALSDTNNL
jgi:hypothetical protein